VFAEFIVGCLLGVNKRQPRTKKVSTKASIYRSFGAQIFHLFSSKGEDQSDATTFESKT
jgi:hypothetical protein